MATGLFFKLEFILLSMKPVYTYKAHVIKVVDGDTIDCSVDLGFNTKTDVRFRIYTDDHSYFDTPETWRPKTEEEAKHGSQAKARASELLEGQEIVLKSVKEGKYRYLAEVFLPDGRNYANVMIEEGYQKRDNYK